MASYFVTKKHELVDLDLKSQKNIEAPMKLDLE